MPVSRWRRGPLGTKASLARRRAPPRRGGAYRTTCARRGGGVISQRVRVLFLENDDSFSWNVIETLPVDRADVCIRSGREVARDPRLLDDSNLVIVGPGPTDPERAGIVGVVLAAARLRRPLLGICLGHQAIGLAYGATLVRVPPVHGKQSRILFSPSRCFPGIAGCWSAMRYHSLALANVEEPLRVIARTEDGIPMAIEHAVLPMAGLQFHPDSFGTPGGARIIAEFFAAVVGYEGAA
jgi:anthranilate synthase/aminodeoxychorismate synthase-like glutamine amidotransferase